MTQARFGGPRLVFVLALGRSGTNFLARLLSHDRNAVVRHEPEPADLLYVPLGWAGNYTAACGPYLTARFERILGDLGPSVRIYAETNGLLRYHAAWLSATLGATVIHLHRDGRDFVRSAYGRPVYTDAEPHAPILPKDDDPAAQYWGQWSRFQKLCWYWDSSNRFLNRSVGRRVAMEAMLRDYSYFHERVLEPSGIHVPEAVWSQEITKPRNTERQSRRRAALRRLLGRARAKPCARLKRWQEWPDELTEQFWQICGETMRCLGYEP